MPLVIHLRKNQKAVLNGAEIENVSGRTISIAVRNEAKVLRSDDMIDPEKAVTPATRAYLALQRAYVQPEQTGHHLAACHAHLAECVTMLADAAPIAAGILAAIDGGNLYVALKRARGLVEHEAAVHVHAAAERKPAAARVASARDAVLSARGPR